MNYLSVCSGIEAATVAWHGLGWKPVGFSEIEKFPSQVLANHYPQITNFGDMTQYKDWNINEPVDLLVGGTPCQSFSVAGLRKGLTDPRGNLALVYLGIADHFKPKWIVWENVPGVLSSNGGRDFGSFLGALEELGYGFAYRVLDAQYFGVPQRRRRVFVVGCLGDWRSAAAVLFDTESLRGNLAPSREKRQEVTEIAGTLSANGGGTTRPAGNANELDFCVATAATLQTGTPSLQGNGTDFEHTVAHTLCARDGAALCAPDIQTYIPTGTCSGKETFGTLMANCGTKQWLGNQEALSGDFHVFALAGNTIGRQPENGGNGTGYDESGVSYTLTKTDQHAVAYGISEKPDLAHCLRSGASKADKHESTTYVAQPIAYSFDSLSSNSMKSLNPDSGCNEVDVAKTLDTSRGLDPSCNQGGIGVAHPMVLMDQGGSVMNVNTDGTVGTLRRETHGHEPIIMQQMQVRRLTPMECERLQGFPDGYTDIQPNGKQTPDGPRYKALGNSMAVPVMKWIGERIQMVENL